MQWSTILRRLAFGVSFLTVAAAVPQSPGMPPALIDSAEAMAFRRAQAELRRTSRLPALNAPVTE